MKVIVFAASKGGVSKTTLAYNLGIEAAKKHTVLLADMDPQESLKEMWHRRGELINPRLVSNISRLAESIRLLKEAGYDRQFMLVDTPGALIPIIRDAIGAADLVVLPTQPSPLDLFAQEAVADIVSEMGVADRTMYVLTRADKRSDIAKKSMSALKERTSLPVPVIGNRVDYAKAMTMGKAAAEINPDAAKEIAELWESIRSVLAAQDLESIGKPGNEHQIH
jgi:chromosome partitioning protein